MSTISEKLALLASTKAAIKAAIEAKGQTVGGIPFSQYPAKIRAIETGGEVVYTLTLNGGTADIDFGTIGVADALEAPLLESNGSPVVLAKSPEGVSAQVVVDGADRFLLLFSIPENASAEEVAGYIDVGLAEQASMAANQRLIRRIAWVQAGIEQTAYFLTVDGETSTGDGCASVISSVVANASTLNLQFQTNGQVEIVSKIGSFFSAQLIYGEELEIGSSTRWGSVYITLTQNNAVYSRIGSIRLALCENNAVQCEIQINQAGIEMGGG